VVYVSCDPATAARDVEVLVAAGWRARSALPLDLMPQTAHVELVITLAR
jgi:23S rRNA (uracil1939-C5)-methyltransferase